MSSARWLPRWLAIARRVLSRFLSIRFLVALSLSTLVWAGLTLDRNPNALQLFNDNISVGSVNLGPNLVLAKPIEPIRVSVRGPQINLARLTLRDFVARVDLAGIGSGNQQVPVIVQISDPAIEVVRVTPATVAVEIDPFEIRSIDVTARLESAPSVGYRAELNEVAAIPAIAQVSGGASDVAKVVSVVVSVSLAGATRDVLAQTLLIPTDRQGDEVPNVMIEPQTAQVNVPITRITSRKRVPVVAELTGKVAPGFFVSEISVVPTTVEIEGQPEDLERVAAIPTSPLAVSGARGDVEAEVAFAGPVGVTILSERPTARVIAVVAPLDDTTTVQAAVITLNLGGGLVAAVTDPSVQVVIGGAAEGLRSIRVGDILAEIDLANLPVGRHQISPTITVPPGIEVTRVTPAYVTVDIQSAPATVPAPVNARLIGAGGAIPTPTPSSDTQAESIMPIAAG